MSWDYDVVIVGARCAGAATARLLSQAGLRVLAVDRASFPSDTLSTHAIAGHGTLLLDRWGLLDAVRATGVPNPRLLGAKLGAVELRDIPVPERSRGTLCPRRIILDALLVDAARDACATVWEDTTVDDLLVEDGVVVGIAGRRNGARVEVRAPLVIGADGVRSLVAAGAGAAVYDVRPSDLSGVFAYYSGTGIEYSELALQPGAFSFAFATNDAQACIGIGVHDRDARALSAGGDGALVAALEHVSPRFAAMVRDGRREGRFSVFRARPGQKRVPHGPGWALVGDAGYYKDPATGQGIADAFLSAQLAADAIVAGLGGAAPLVETLDGYHRQRDALHADMYDVTHAFAMLDFTEEELVLHFLRYRELSERLLVAVDELVPVASGA